MIAINIAASIQWQLSERMVERPLLGCAVCKQGVLIYTDTRPPPTHQPTPHPQHAVTAPCTDAPPAGHVKIISDAVWSKDRKQGRKDARGICHAQTK